MYKIQPYIWNDIKDEQTIFQTKNSTVIITNSNLRNFLINIEKNNILEVNEQMFDEAFGKEEKLRVIDFLLQQKILKKEEQRDPHINRVIFLSNDSKFIESVKYNLEGIYELLVITYEKFKEFQFKNTDFLIVFLNPFELKIMENLVDISKKRNVLCKFIFSYNNKIYFANYYKRSWYNPCPLCFFGAIESQIRGEDNDNNINFQTIIDLLYAKNILFKSELPLDKLTYLQIIYILSSYMGEIPENYKLDEVLELNLSNYSVRRDIAYHWGYCDCYE